MSVDFDFSQVDKLTVELGAAAVAITGKNEAIVLTPTAREVQAEASARAPRRTGELAASIRIMESGVGFRVVGSDVRQAFYQEFGTSVMAPQPFMFAAGDKGGDAMAKLLETIADPLP